MLSTYDTSFIGDTHPGGAQCGVQLRFCTAAISFCTGSAARIPAGPRVRRFSSVPGPDGAAGGGGSAGAGGAGGTAGAGGASTPCALSFQFTTVAYSGRFSPRNVGAVWVMIPENRFVETLELWATVRANHLVNSNQQTEANRVDVVNSATL